MTAENKNILGTVKERALAPIERAGRLLMFQIAIHRAVRASIRTENMHGTYLDDIGPFLVIAIGYGIIFGKSTFYVARRKIREYKERGLEPHNADKSHDTEKESFKL